MKFFMKNKLFVVAVAALVLVYLWNPHLGQEAGKSALGNFLSVAMILPPIFVLIGLLDVWVPKTLMVRYMGQDSGLKGGLIAVFLGAVGAGPLVVAFPVAALLIKKGARLAYVFLFLGAWTSVKLPIFMFELANFGAKFTSLHVVSSMSIYLVGAILLEKVLTKEDQSDIMDKAEQYA